MSKQQKIINRRRTQTDADYFWHGLPTATHGLHGLLTAENAEIAERI
jgi:hypothetical protein